MTHNHASLIQTPSSARTTCRALQALRASRLAEPPHAQTVNQRHWTRVLSRAPAAASWLSNGGSKYAEQYNAVYTDFLGSAQQLRDMTVRFPSCTMQAIAGTQLAAQHAMQHAHCGIDVPLNNIIVTQPYRNYRFSAVDIASHLRQCPVKEIRPLTCWAGTQAVQHIQPSAAQALLLPLFEAIMQATLHDPASTAAGSVPLLLLQAVQAPPPLPHASTIKQPPTASQAVRAFDCVARGCGMPLALCTPIYKAPQETQCAQQQQQRRNPLRPQTAHGSLAAAARTFTKLP